jgi:hypothetical protein
LLIAQFAKNQDPKLSKKIDGQILWTILFRQIINIGIAYRVISIDCKEPLVKYYEK